MPIMRHVRCYMMLSSMYLACMLDVGGFEMQSADSSSYVEEISFIAKQKE